MTDAQISVNQVEETLTNFEHQGKTAMLMAVNGNIKA